MTNKDRNKKFKKARTEALRERIRIQRDTAAEVTRLLKKAKGEITNTLKHSPSEWQAWYLPQLKQSINQALNDFVVAGTGVMNAGAGDAWQAGVDSLDKPIAAGGVNIVGMLPGVDTRQLVAMRFFLTDKIKDIGTTLTNKINSQLGLVAIGTQPVGDAVAQISSLLDGGHGRSRAITIVRTELGRTYSIAANERFQQAKEYLPGLKKQWRRSGKIHSRLSHDAADGQIAEVEEPFIIGGARLMFPRDPAAPAAETINCGCESLAWMEKWDVATPGKKPFTDLELANSPNKRNLAAAQQAGAAELRSPKIRRAVSSVEKRFAGQAIEHAAVIGKDGKVLFEKVGDAGSVKLSPKELKQLKGNVVTHNHPGVGSFSEDDIGLGAVHQAAEVRVVDELYSYSMRPPAGGWDRRKWSTAILPAMQAIEAEVMGEFLDALNVGKMTQAAFDENYQHEVWRRVNKQIDMKYRRRKRKP